MIKKVDITNRLQICLDLLATREKYTNIPQVFQALPPFWTGKKTLHLLPANVSKTGVHEKWK